MYLNIIKFTLRNACIPYLGNIYKKDDNCKWSDRIFYSYKNIIV